MQPDRYSHEWLTALALHDAQRIAALEAQVANLTKLLEAAETVGTRHADARRVAELEVGAFREHARRLGCSFGTHELKWWNRVASVTMIELQETTA